MWPFKKNKENIEEEEKIKKREEIYQRCHLQAERQTEEQLGYKRPERFLDVYVGTPIIDTGVKFYPIKRKLYVFYAGENKADETIDFFHTRKEAEDYIENKIKTFIEWKKVFNEHFFTLFDESLTEAGLK